MTAPAPRENPHLAGHEAAELAWLEAARSRLPHAWLITGPEGVGKATLAFRCARWLLAGGGGNGLAVAPEHPVARRVAAGSHADLFTVERDWDEKNNRLKRDIAAERVRQAPGFLRLTPAEGGWRVVVIDGAEDMNATSANALLKVLEEPPARSVLLLVSAAPGRLLPTIRSRCRHMALAPLAAPAMEQALGLLLPALSAADRAALAAEAHGSPGQAVRLASDGGLKILAMVAEVLGALPAAPSLRAYEIADKLRDEPAFELFFQLLRRRIAGAAIGSVRGNGEAAQAPLSALKSASRWGDIWSSLGRIEEETRRFNLDRRQAVVAGLGLLG